MIINLKLKQKISELPLILQNRIYIFALKQFWKSYTPLMARIPSWWERKIRIDKLIYESRIKNIHFLHLPFNTLDENKKWIMGCQCDYCRNIKYKYKHKLYRKQFYDPDYFKEKMPHSTVSFCNDEYYLVKDNDTMMYFYDPLCGSTYEENIKYALRTGKIQISF